MKRLLSLITFFALSICSLFAQNDTLYMMKDGVVVGKYNTTTDIDSMIFYKPPITSVTDVDGNIYKVVTIGNQVWMAENLKVTKYNDGTAIPLVTDNAIWIKLDDTDSPGYCYYDNDVSNASSYGALYNWYAVSSSTNGGKNVCPSGWHVPSDGEWTTLTDYIGIRTDAGAKLKSTSGWQEYNGQSGNGTDDYGFSGVPSGERHYKGVFVDIGKRCNWWSSTSHASNQAWFRSLFYYNNTVGGSYNWKEEGISVRCVRD